MANQQKLREILEKLKRWKEAKGDEELGDIITELESAAYAPQGDDEGDGSNPPHGPGTPP